MKIITDIAADYKAHKGQSGITGVIKTMIRSPGFSTVTSHRIAAALYRRGGIIRQLGYLLWRWNTNRSSCHISLSAQLGRGLALPHPCAIVIGDGSIIGNNVTIYQSVTIGTRSPDVSEYPIIENDTTVFPGAVIVGKISIGTGSKIGANSFVSKNVAPFATIAGNGARRTANKDE